ncbi:hypothetical protein OD91_1335 [Lutibacter sp. Hel_I_33_5]|uniref:hypothetical protein n=1 Tax=Lutibacter sp. Hel_I_33_5 TaxID=1566289 RepID=UPI0011A26091|nr:hypothetical protein [Lutibacter sp. Hel_I_33_5]TVZ56056.1 hypothetical protein OD91_1335 [Lutibacter sp. Hel_I_33_5]
MIKKVFILFTFLICLSCTDTTENNDVLPFVQVNVTVDLNLPQFLDLRVPGGWAYSSGGISGIIIYNLNGNQFKAFERSCPHIPVSNCTRMQVENNIKMKCLCDDSEFNILNGSPITSGIDKFAREYLVTNLNGTILRITNF